MSDKSEPGYKVGPCTSRKCPIVNPDEDSLSIDWGAVSGAASAATSIVALAGIALAYRGVRISRDASLLDRRNYLDGIYVRWLDSIDALDRAALPYLEHVPTQPELDHGRPIVPDAYSEFHLAFTHCQTATELLATTGLFDHAGKNDQPGEIATEEIAKVFNGVLWAYYFSVIQYSPTEAAAYGENQGLLQTWSSAMQETEEQLESHHVPAKYFAMFRAKIGEIYPETSSLSVWQATNSLLNVCKTQLANQYQRLVSSRFPWDPGARSRS